MGGERMRWRQVVAGLSAPQHEEGQVQLLLGLRWGEALEEVPGAPSPLYQPGSEPPLPWPCCPVLLPAAPCPLLSSQHLSRLLQTVLNAHPHYPLTPSSAPSHQAPQRGRPSQP